MQFNCILKSKLSIMSGQFCCQKHCSYYFSRNYNFWFSYCQKISYNMFVKNRTFTLFILNLNLSWSSSYFSHYGVFLCLCECFNTLNVCCCNCLQFFFYLYYFQLYVWVTSELVKCICRCSTIRSHISQSNVAFRYDKVIF